MGYFFNLWYFLKIIPNFFDNSGGRMMRILNVYYCLQKLDSYQKETDFDEFIFFYQNTDSLLSEQLRNIKHDIA